MNNLQRILLIDDSETDNFIHRRRFTKLGICEQVDVCSDGQQGLQYLTTPGPDGQHPRPDLLFLDINMPVMDGWEFLDAYRHLPDHQRARVTVAMLTTAVGDDDLRRTYSFGVVDAHEAKPLSDEKLRKLLRRFFPHRPA